MTKLAPEWIRNSDPVIRSPARYRWTTAPASTIFCNESDDDDNAYVKFMKIFTDIFYISFKKN